MARKRATISDVLKQAIRESGLAHIAIERATGVKRASIMRFLRGEQSLRLDMAGRLTDYFGLRLEQSGYEGESSNKAMTCYHEAGHAVLAWLLKVPFIQVVIERERG